MSKFEKLLQRIKQLNKDLRFDVVRKVLLSYGYVFRFPHSGSSHATFRKEGYDFVTLPHEPIKRKNVVDAKREWLVSAIEDGADIPEPAATEDANQYSGQFKLRLPKVLHKTLAEHAKHEGISMNQYCMYLLSRNDALHSMA